MSDYKKRNCQLVVVTITKLSFVNDVQVVGKEMTRNAGKMAKLIGCAFRFETEFSFKMVADFYYL